MSTTAAAAGRQRWWICALLFVATTIHGIGRFGGKRRLAMTLTLLTAASALALAGLALAWLISLNWQACVAAVGLGLIGSLLTCAGRSHGGPASLLPATP